MASTHPDAILKRALVAILDTDATIVALCGRANGNVGRGNLESAAAVPGVFFQLIGFGQVGEEKDARDGIVQFTFVAPDDDVADDLKLRVEQLLTAPAFYAQGLDAAPILWTTRDLPSGPGSESDEGPHLRTRNLSVCLSDLALTYTV